MVKGWTLLGAIPAEPALGRMMSISPSVQDFCLQTSTEIMSGGVSVGDEGHRRP